MFYESIAKVSMMTDYVHEEVGLFFKYQNKRKKAAAKRKLTATVWTRITMSKFLKP